MSDSPSHRILDFHSPRRPPNEAWRKLSTWLKNSCAQIQDGWSTLLAQSVTLHSGPIDPSQFDAALRRLPADGMGISFALGEDHLPSMFIFSDRQIQALIADVIDLPGDTWPESRRRTAAEDAILELLFQKLGEGISEAWPASTPIACRYLDMAPKPQRTRLFPMGADLLVLQLTIKSRFGEDVGYWLMLKEDTEELLLNHFGADEPDERFPHPDLALLAERVPLQVVVELGQAELSMSQAENLSIGDVLILDQFVARPLVATLEGQAKWGGNPVRIGTRQGFEITNLLDSQSFGLELNRSDDASSPSPMPVSN